MEHAERGATARVRVRWEPDGLTLMICDRTEIKSRQSASMPSGPGLTERVHLLGGSLDIGPVSDGFLVHAHLPSLPPGTLHHLANDVGKEEL